MKQLLFIAVLISTIGYGQKRSIEPSNNDIQQQDLSIVSDLKKGYSLNIDFTTSGCFNYSQERLLVYTENDVLMAELYVNDELKKKVPLDVSSLDAITEFEIKARQNENRLAGCTTSEFYIVSINGELLFTVNDSSCEWWGFKFLKNGLFGS